MGAAGRGSAAPLQWSRNLRVAESRVSRFWTRITQPLQWSRNLRVAESRRFARAIHVPDIASMEPQLEGCGKLRMGKPRPGPAGLQWSRNLRVAESDIEGPSWLSTPGLQWSRNLRVAESMYEESRMMNSH